MKVLSKAPPVDFDIYVARADTTYIEREDEPLEVLYALGFLPYSGAQGVHNIFYNARSARIDLQNFTLTSENRRIAKKFDGQFSKERVPFRDFDSTEAFIDFCVSYFAQKHGASAMPRERLDYILHSGLITSTSIYRSAAKPVAYVLEVGEGAMAHFWFSFYDLAYARQSLGLWLMLDCLRDAQAAGKKYYYLGTVYGEKALYKTNFMPLQWWDGQMWSINMRALKTLALEQS
jgi:arginine-tRNA-protein transferase